MHHGWWGHCPCHHDYYPGWAESYPPPSAYPPPPSAHPPPLRDEYVRRLESERDMLEQRLRRLEQQFAEFQRGAGQAG
jgi:hypothetical protein